MGELKVVKIYVGDYHIMHVEDPKLNENQVEEDSIFVFSINMDLVKVNEMGIILRRLN